MECFVIGPIGDQLAEPGTPERLVYEQALQVFEEVVKAACGPMGIDAYRADDMDDAGEIPEQIFEALRDKELVIADLTGANPNVMYELGVRHVTAKCTIQIGEKGRLPFDVSTIRTVQFKRTPNGLITARNKLAQMIGNVLANGCAPTTAARIIGLHVGASRSSDDGPEPERSYAGEPEAEPEPPDAELEAPMGVLEAQVELEDGLPDLGERISLMGELIERIAALTNGYSPKVSQAVKPAQRLGLMASYARELEPLAKEFDNESVEFDARVSSVGLAVGTMLEHLEVDRDVEGAKEFVDGLVGMAQAARSAHDEGMSVFRSSLDKVVGLSRELRPVVQLLSRAVDRTMDDLQHVIAWGDRAAAIALVLGAAGDSEERTS